VANFKSNTDALKNAEEPVRLAPEDHLPLQIQYPSFSSIHMLKILFPNTHTQFKYFHHKRNTIWTKLNFSVFEMKAY